MENFKYLLIQLHVPLNFSYNKEENVKLSDPKLLGFTHLLVEQKGKYFYENEDIRRTHDILDTINCFSNIGVEYRSVFPIKIKTRPCIIILRRKPGIVPPKLEVVTEEPIDDDSNDESEENGNNETEEIGNIDRIENTIQTDYHDDLEVKEPQEIEEVDYVEVIEDPNTKEEPNDDDDVDEEASVLDDASDALDSNTLNDDEHNILENELKKPTIETKHKLRRLIERHYRFKEHKALPSDRIDAAAGNKQSIKSKVRHIIKKEKIREMIEHISQIDLRTVCNLERETTKQCVLKIVDSYTG